MNTTAAKTIVMGCLFFCLSTNMVLAQPSDRPMTFQLEFAGGTTGEFVDLIRQKVPDFEFVITPSASKSRLESIKLDRVSPYLLPQLIPKLNPQLSVDQLGGVGGTLVVHISLPRTIGVESIGDLISSEGRSLADILAAIDLALRFVPTGDRAEIKVHEETGLLIVSGSREQVGTVSTVVSSLRSGRTSPHSIAQAGSEESHLTVDELRSRIQALNVEIMHKNRLLRAYEEELKAKSVDDPEEQQTN